MASWSGWLEYVVLVRWLLWVYQDPRGSRFLVPSAVVVPSRATDDHAGRFLGLWPVLGVRVLFRVFVDVDDVWLAVGP